MTCLIKLRTFTTKFNKNRYCFVFKTVKFGVSDKIEVIMSKFNNNQFLLLFFENFNFSIFVLFCQFKLIVKDKYIIIHYGQNLGRVVLKQV